MSQLRTDLKTKVGAGIEFRGYADICHMKFAEPVSDGGRAQARVGIVTPQPFCCRLLRLFDAGEQMFVQPFVNAGEGTPDLPSFRY